jgi:hypothetical protein
MKRSHKRLSKTRWQLHVFLALGLAGLFVNTFFLYSSRKDELKVENMIVSKKTNSKVCICLSDDRYSEQDLQMAVVDSRKALRDFVGTRFRNLSDLGYWQKTAIINVAYAMTFGHQVIMSNLSAYRNVYREKRPSVWLKPSFMLDVQLTRPDCDWFGSIDSDAYLWMSKHTVDLRDWFSTGSLHEATPSYYEFETEKRRRRGFYDWDEQKAFFLVGLNGMFSTPAEGFPNTYEDTHNDFICAGVYFIKNDARSKQFLHDWVSGPVDSSAEERAIIQEYALKFSLEQRVLNMVLYPRYKDGIHIYSYRDFGSKDGPLIRHTWSQFHQERHPLMNRDLLNLDFQ